MKIETMRKPGAILGIAVIDVGTLARNWWVVLLRGVAGIIFGLATFFAPEISLTALVLVFGAYAFLDGVLALISAIRRRGATDHWWLLVTRGSDGRSRGSPDFRLAGYYGPRAALPDRRLGIGNRRVGDRRGHPAAQGHHRRVAARVDRDRIRCALAYYS